MKRLPITLLLVLFAATCFADKNTNKGDEQFELGNYREALQYYTQVEEPDFHVEEKVAQCHYYLFEYTLAEKELAEIVDRDGVSSLSLFMYAEILMNHADYQKAITYYKRCTDTEMHQFVELEVESCNWAMEHEGDLPEFDLQLLNIETGGRSMGVAPYAGGLIYAHPSDAEFMEATVYYDLAFVQQQDSVNYSQPVHIATEFNTSFYEGAPSVSADGKHLYFTRNASEKESFKTGKHGKHNISSGGVNTLEILVAEQVDGKWANPTQLEFNDTEHSYTHPCISPDGNTLYFVSNREGGYGGYDIYRSEKTANGWGEPINLGADINSDQNEMFPFLFDDKLYFASKGHVGFGGYDVYYSNIYDTKYGKPVNAGVGLNSAKDDFAVVFNADGESGYISSNRAGDNGYDRIYTFSKIIYPEIITAVVKDKVTYKPIHNAEVTLFKANGDLLSEQYTDEQGILDLELYPNREYAVSFYKEGYEQLDLVIPVGEGREEVLALLGMIELLLEPKKDVVINLDNIYFDYGEATLRPESYPILDRLFDYLQLNADITVELSAHTDSRSSHSYNKRLSNDRAQSCYEYLIEKGIDKKRMKPIGYGETKLVNQCADGVDCTEEEHQLNRRVEIKIL